MKTINFEYPYYDLIETGFPSSRCIGNNAKQTLVLAEQKDFEEHGALLTKVMRAVNLDFEDDISFISIQKDESLSLLNTASCRQYKHILLFGIAPHRIGLANNPSVTLLNLEHLTIIISEPLRTIATDANAKRALWGHLKNVFNR